MHLGDLNPQHQEQDRQETGKSLALSYMLFLYFSWNTYAVEGPEHSKLYVQNLGMP